MSGRPIFQTALVAAMLVLTGAAGADIAACHSLDDSGAAGAKDCYLELLQTESNDAVRAEALWRV